MLYRQGALNGSKGSGVAKSVGVGSGVEGGRAKGEGNFGFALSSSTASHSASTAKQSGSSSPSSSKITSSTVGVKVSGGVKPKSTLLPAQVKKSGNAPVSNAKSGYGRVGGVGVAGNSVLKMSGDKRGEESREERNGEKTENRVGETLMEEKRRIGDMKREEKDEGSKVRWSEYGKFRFKEEEEEILKKLMMRLGETSNNMNSLEKLRKCLISKEEDVYMSGVAIAGYSVEKGHGIKEIFIFLSDGNPLVFANTCEALINGASSAKLNPSGEFANQLSKLTISSFNDFGKHFLSLPSLSPQRFNILKFLANALSFTKIIPNMLKSTALTAFTSKIWGKDSNGRFLGSDEECHALLIIMNNLIASSKPQDWKSILEEGTMLEKLSNVLKDFNHLDWLSIAIQISNSLCQDPSTIPFFTRKDKPFIHSLIQVLKLQKIDSNLQLRISRLCGSLMQNYDGLKLLTNAGVFKFYSNCISMPSNDEVIMTILATIANLALADHLTPNLPQLMDDSKILISLQDLLTKSQIRPETRIRAGIAISNLMTVENLQAPFTSSGGIKTLLSTASKTNNPSNDHDAEIFQKSLSALFHLSLYYDSIRNHMVKEGILKSLGGMISSSGENGKSSFSSSQSTSKSDPSSSSFEKAKTAAIKTLYNISMTDGTEIEFIKQNAIAPLITILKSSSTGHSMNKDDDHQNMSAAILENLSQNSIFQDHLLSSGGVDSILSLISSSSGKVQERSARLIARLAVNGNVRKHLQKSDASKRLKSILSSSSSSSSKSAIDMALHNINIPVDDDYSSSSSNQNQNSYSNSDEDPLIAKLASEFDLDDDGSIGALDRLLHETGQSSSINLSSPPSSSSPFGNSSPLGSSSPKMTSSSNVPSSLAKKFPSSIPSHSSLSSPKLSSSPPNPPFKPNPSANLYSNASSNASLPPGNAKSSGPPPLPPKPPPKPSLKKMNAARRALMSQPPRPSPLAKSTGMVPKRPKMAGFASPSPHPSHHSSPSSPVLVQHASQSPRNTEDGDEAFEDRGLKKESYMLVGSGDALASGGKKKKGGLLTSLKNLFSSSESHESELMNSLHSGPWQVDESVVSQKCPSLIYDYYDHWCESCKRDGSICVQSADELRKLRMRLIRSKEPKSFAPPKASRERSNSDPIQTIGLSKETKSEVMMGSNGNNGENNGGNNGNSIHQDASQSQMPQVQNQTDSSITPSNSATIASSSSLSRPPPPSTMPPIASMPIPQKIIVSPRKASVSSPSNAIARSQIQSLANNGNNGNNSGNNSNVSNASNIGSSSPINVQSSSSSSSSNQQPQKMPSHPPQPSLLENPKKSPLPHDADPEMVMKAKKHVKRTHVAQELLATEGTYMQCLGIILKKFQGPLTSSLATPKPLVSEGDIRTIFGSIEIIYNVNLVLIERLNVKMSRWSSKQTLGDVFIYMADWLKIYTDYVNNYDKSQSCLLKCKEESPRFSQFLMDRSMDPVCALRGLETFLVTPIQRLPRYSLLLRELIKNTDENHPDWKDLNLASGRIESVTAYLNEKRREFESRFKMFSLAHSLTSSKIRAQIVQPHRENLLESDAIEWKFKSSNKTKSGHGRLYLLNDAFLLTKIISKTRQKLVLLIPLSQIAASIPPFSSGITDDPHLKELTLLDISTQDFILITFPAVENRDQMYNQYQRIQPNLLTHSSSSGRLSQLN